MVHSIAYASRTLHQHEKNYTITELEALGITWAIKHFHHYFYGHHYEVYTHHAPLHLLSWLIVFLFVYACVLF